MTHDWFSHLQEGHNQSEMMAVGCARERIGNVEEESPRKKKSRSWDVVRMTAWTRVTSLKT
jgi:hypothetical protein